MLGRSPWLKTTALLVFFLWLVNFLKNLLIIVVDLLKKPPGLFVFFMISSMVQPLAHHWNVTSLNLFWRYCFGGCSSVHLFILLLWRSTYYSVRLHDFFVTISRCYKEVYVNSFFPHTVRVWNSLPIECFSLTFDLNDF